MKITSQIYKGYEIQKRVDTKNNTCTIYKGYQFIKGIAGNIAEDGSENSIEKAKAWIDSKTN